jgi:hypothetical protein
MVVGLSVRVCQQLGSNSCKIKMMEELNEGFKKEVEDLLAYLSDHIRVVHPQRLSIDSGSVYSQQDSL